MSKPTILIVDDEPDVITLLERTLRLEGFEVLTAYDGLAAMDIAENDQPGLILLDIMMPMMSGYEVCEQLKANPQTKHIPIICVTSAHGQANRENAQRAGAQALIMKPFMTKELIAQINRYLKPADA